MKLNYMNLLSYVFAHRGKNVKISGHVYYFPLAIMFLTIHLEKLKLEITRWIFKSILGAILFSDIFSK